MKKILIISYYWPPSGGAGVQRWLKFTKYLPEFGIQPIVLTVDPSIASYAQVDESLNNDVPDSVIVHRSKTVEFYNLYKRLTGEKNIPYGGFANEGKESFLQKLAKIVRGNFFLPDPRKGWNKYAYQKAVELIESHQIDTVITTSPPHSTQLIGLKLKKKMNIRWVADMRDPWTDIYYYTELKHTGLARKLDAWLEKKVLSNADQIITVSEDIKRMFSLKLDNGDGSKIQVIPNGYDEDDFKQQIEKTDDRFVITYTGTISESYDISAFVSALESLSESKRSEILLRFVGRVPSSIVNQIKKNIPDLEIDLVGYVPHQESITYLLKSSMQLLVIPKVENNRGIVTGKFYEYLASSKPIMAIGPIGGDLECLMNETKCGRFFDYSDSEIIDMLQELIGGNYSHVTNDSQNYSRRNLTQKLVQGIEITKELSNNG